MKERVINAEIINNLVMVQDASEYDMFFVKEIDHVRIEIVNPQLIEIFGLNKLDNQFLEIPKNARTWFKQPRFWCYVKPDFDIEGFCKNVIEKLGTELDWCVLTNPAIPCPATEFNKMLNNSNKHIS